MWPYKIEYFTISMVILTSEAGADPENSERGDQAPFPLASYTNTFYFSDNSIKILQNFKEKGVARAPSTHPQIHPCEVHVVKYKIPVNRLLPVLFSLSTL